MNSTRDATDGNSKQGNSEEWPLGDAILLCVCGSNRTKPKQT
jgi:hypothetical protein